MSNGNCYYTSEALYHLLGGKSAGWKPMHMRHERQSHWFLKHESGLVLDATFKQFKTKPNYKKAKGKGFLTKYPSRAAAKMMRMMVWKDFS